MEIEFYIKLKKDIENALGINLDSYKDEQMRRRLDAWLVRSGIPSWKEYLQKVKTDENESARFRNYITINVTEFFRDIDKWNFLRQNIIPELLKEANKTRPLGEGIRLWSAGCSIGAEAYSLVFSLDEIARGRKHYILASDLDRGALSKAKSGGPYIADDIKQISEDQRKVFFKPDGPPFYVNQKFVNQITFKEHNLLADPYEKNFDLIICRNVVIYFTGEAKDHIFRSFNASLRLGGILFLGGTEIIPRPQEIGFASNGISFYKRIQ